MLPFRMFPESYNPPPAIATKWRIQFVTDSGICIAACVTTYVFYGGQLFKAPGTNIESIYRFTLFLWKAHFIDPPFCSPAIKNVFKQREMIC